MSVVQRHGRDAFPILFVLAGTTAHLNKLAIPCCFCEVAPLYVKELSALRRLRDEEEAAQDELAVYRGQGSESCPWIVRRPFFGSGGDFWLTYRTGMDTNAGIPRTARNRKTLPQGYQAG